MGVELRERKWCGVLGIEKVGVEGCWMVFTIGHGLRGMTEGRASYSMQFDRFDTVPRFPWCSNQEDYIPFDKCIMFHCHTYSCFIFWEVFFIVIFLVLLQG